MDEERNEGRAHSFPNGTVTVKMHKTRRLTLVVDREELNAEITAQIEEQRVQLLFLRRLVSTQKAKLKRAREFFEGIRLLTVDELVPEIRVSVYDMASAALAELDPTNHQPTESEAPGV